MHRTPFLPTKVSLITQIRKSEQFCWFLSLREIQGGIAKRHGGKCTLNSLLEVMLHLVYFEQSTRSYVTFTSMLLVLEMSETSLVICTRILVSFKNIRSCRYRSCSLKAFFKIHYIRCSDYIHFFNKTNLLYVVS